METTTTTASSVTVPEDPQRRLADLGAVTLLFSVAGTIVVAAVLSGFYSGVPAQMTDEVAA